MCEFLKIETSTTQFNKTKIQYEDIHNIWKGKNYPNQTTIKENNQTNVHK